MYTVYTTHIPWSKRQWRKNLAIEKILIHFALLSRRIQFIRENVDVAIVQKGAEYKNKKHNTKICVFGISVHYKDKNCVFVYRFFSMLVFPFVYDVKSCNLVK